MIKLEISPSAIGDIQEFIDYYEPISDKLADQFLESLNTEFDRITQNPNSFSIKYRETRVRYLLRFPAGLHYTILNDTTIIILAVLHTSSNPKNWNRKHKE